MGWIVDKVFRKQPHNVNSANFGDIYVHWPGCGIHPGSEQLVGSLSMQNSVRRQKLCEREQERKRNGAATAAAVTAAAVLLNQRGKEFEGMCVTVVG